MNHVNMRLLLAHVLYTHGLPSRPVDSLVWSGRFGAQIFFVISGYLITSTSMRRWGHPCAISIKDFYTLRFARIAPLMLSLLAALCALHIAHVTDYVVSVKTGGLHRGPVEVVPPPPPEHRDWAWHAGYHRWDGHGYVWVPGRYEQPPYPHAHWVEGHWPNRGGGYVWVKGHWRR